MKQKKVINLAEDHITYSRQKSRTLNVPWKRIFI